MSLCAAPSASRIRESRTSRARHPEAPVTGLRRTSLDANGRLRTNTTRGTRPDDRPIGTPPIASYLRRRSIRPWTLPDPSGRYRTTRSSQVVGKPGFEPGRAEALRILSPMGTCPYVCVKPDSRGVSSSLAFSLRELCILRPATGRRRLWGLRSDRGLLQNHHARPVRSERQALHPRDAHRGPGHLGVPRSRHDRRADCRRLPRADGPGHPRLSGIRSRSGTKTMVATGVGPRGERRPESCTWSPRWCSLSSGDNA